jgi:hypothetical protein
MKRFSTSGLGLLLAAVALSACQTGPQAGSASSGPVISAPAPAAIPAAPPAVRAPAPQVAAIPPAPPINDDPSQLMGLDRGGLTALLGAPDLVRREAPAEIWQYLAVDCVFDVVLYERGQNYNVSYLEARNAAALPQEPRPCLNSLLRARQSTPVS